MSFEYEYLHEFDTELKIILGESWAHMVSIHEKTRGRKSHITVSLCKFFLPTSAHWCQCQQVVVFFKFLIRNSPKFYIASRLVYRDLEELFVGKLSQTSRWNVPLKTKFFFSYLYLLAY
jgi:hypothetical protein